MQSDSKVEFVYKNWNYWHQYCLTIRNHILCDSFKTTRSSNLFEIVS